MDLINLDIWLFFLVNHSSANVLFDILMPALTSRGYLLALPFGAYMIALALKQTPEKRRGELYYAIWTIVVAVISFMVADWTTNEIKYFIERIRPCNALEGVRLLGGCSKSFSMPSGHSTNSFAYAFALFIMARGRVSLPWRIYPLVLAALVAYSRPYIGVHYPADIVSGAVVGALSAITMATLFRFAAVKYRTRPFATVFYGLLIATGIFRFYHILRGPLGLSYGEAVTRLGMAVSDPLGFETGPLASWLLSAGSALFGDNVSGIRIFALVLSLLTLYLIFRLVREMYNDEAPALWAVVLLMVVPAFSLSGVILSYESVLVFSWMLSLFLFYRAAVSAEGPAAHKSVWLCLGVSAGLGLLADYMMFFFYIGMFLCLLMSDRRHLLKTAWPYISVVTGLIVFSLTGLIETHTLRIDTGPDITVSMAQGADLMQFAVKQAVFITPIVFCLVFYALHRLFYRDRGFRSTYLFAFSIPVLIFSFISCMLVNHQPALAVTGYLTGLIAVAALFFRSERSAGVISAGRVIVYAAVAVALSVTAISHFPTLNRFSPKFDPVLELRGWKELGAAVGDLAGRSGNNKQVSIISDNRLIAAELAFYSKGRPVIWYIGPPGRHITLNMAMTSCDYGMSGSGAGVYPERKTAIVVTEGGGGVPAYLAGSCENAGQEQISLKHKGRELKSYSAFICYNFRDMQGGQSE